MTMHSRLDEASRRSCCDDDVAGHGLVLDHKGDDHPGPREAVLCAVCAPAPRRPQRGGRCRFSSLIKGWVTGAGSASAFGCADALPATPCAILDRSGEYGRDVAQLGRALDWGSRGRGFKSRRPDQRRPVASLGVNPGLWPVCWSPASDQRGERLGVLGPLGDHSCPNLMGPHAVEHRLGDR